jgi:rare lipoprotein A
MPRHTFGNARPNEFRTVLLLTMAAGALLFSGCHHRRRPVTVPPRPAAPIIQGEQGIASWYGYPYHGRRTSSGEIYNMHDMTAAHRTLPFGTRVKVHNLDNGRSVTVRINDRGPFVEGRIIDLSYAAAKAIGMSGLAPVRLEILSLGTIAVAPPPPAAVPAPDQGTTPSSQPLAGAFAVQVGSFTDRRNAEALRDAIAPHFGPVTIQTFDSGNGIFYRVRVGSEETEQAARALGEKLRDAGFANETFVVRLD